MLSRHHPAGILSAALIGLMACGESTPPTEPAIAQVAVSPPDTTLVALGATVQLTAVARDAAGTVVSGRTATWQTSQPTVASVTTAGLVTAVGTGTAQVRGTVDGIAGTATIHVEQRVAAVEFTSPPTALVAGDSAFITTRALDGNANVVTGAVITLTLTRLDSSGAAAVAALRITCRSCCCRSGRSGCSPRERRWCPGGGRRASSCWRRRS